MPKPISTSIVKIVCWGTLILAATILLIYFFSISDDTIQGVPYPTIQSVEPVIVPIWEKQWESSNQKQQEEYCTMYNENPNMLYAAFRYGSNEYQSEDWYNGELKDNYDTYFKTKCNNA